jgi:uncharacterized membrane protein YhaH (DUF805 family)
MSDDASKSSPPAPPTLSAFLSRHGSPHGRMGRRGYWIGISIAGLLLLGAFFLLVHASNPKGRGDDTLVVALMLVLLALFFWIHALVTVKRLRDAGQPAWTCVIYVFGAIAWAALVGSSTESAVAALVGVVILVLPGFYKREPDPAAEAEAV